MNDLAAAAPKEEESTAETVGHAVLSGVGLVPVVGEAADLANAGWYGAQGKTADAALSASAAIPIVGWGATAGKVGKTAYKGIKAADEAAEATLKARRSAVAARDLRRELASESQMTGPGKVIAGPGSKDPLRASQRLSDTYGGKPEDWVKKTGPQYDDKEAKFQTRWYENTQTGERVEFKTKFPDLEKQHKSNGN